MDLETAQRIERLEYQIAVLYRHLGLDPNAAFGQPRDAVPGDPRLPREFYTLIEQRKLIQAIKVYREVTGAGLKESKDYVDGVARDRGGRR